MKTPHKTNMAIVKYYEPVYVIFFCFKSIKGFALQSYFIHINDWS